MMLLLIIDYLGSFALVIIKEVNDHSLRRWSEMKVRSLAMKQSLSEDSFNGILPVVQSDDVHVVNEGQESLTSKLQSRGFYSWLVEHEKKVSLYNIFFKIAILNRASINHPPTGNT